MPLGSPFEAIMVAHNGAHTAGPGSVPCFGLGRPQAIPLSTH
jgi:hypothetical protein